MDVRCNLGVVRYLNTLPLIEGLDQLAGLDLHPAAPAGLSAMLRNRTVDLALISVVDAMRPAQPDPARSDLTLIPVGMIGCDGPTMTVRVVSRVPIEQISTLALDDESHTSAVLCRIILEEMFGICPQYTTRTASAWLESADDRRAIQSALLIGDKVIQAPPLDDFPYQLDLGEQWHKLTGLPFVYAMWACRSGEERDDRVRYGCSLLDRQLRRNLARTGWLVAARADEFAWPRASAERYIRQLLRYEVDARSIAGLSAFFDRCDGRGYGTAPPVVDEWKDACGPIAR